MNCVFLRKYLAFCYIGEPWVYNKTKRANIAQKYLTKLESLMINNLITMTDD